MFTNQIDNSNYISLEKKKTENYIRFNTKLGDEYLVVTLNSNKNQRLTLKTIYTTKKGVNPSVSDTTKAPLFTSETSSVSSTPLFNNNISQNEEDVNTDNKKYVNYTSKIENSTHIRYNFY